MCVLTPISDFFVEKNLGYTNLGHFISQTYDRGRGGRSMVPLHFVGLSITTGSSRNALTLTDDRTNSGLTSPIGCEVNLTTFFEPFRIILISNLD